MGKVENLEKESIERKLNKPESQGKDSQIDCRQKTLRDFFDSHKGKVYAKKAQIEKADKENADTCCKLKEFDISEYEETLARLNEASKGLTKCFD